MRQLSPLLLLLLACGCDDGGSAGTTAAADAATVDAVAADAGGQSEAEAVEAFCTASAEARCEWAFECVGASAALSNVLGLSGPAKADCAAAAAAECAAPAATLTERGTLVFDPSGAETCVTRLAAAPCGMGPADEWISDYHKYVTNNCHGALHGSVESGGACVDGLDCADKTEICGDGQCRKAVFDDLLSACDGAGGPGELRADDSCSGQACAAMRANDQDITGLCTVDCNSGFGCPAGSYCLQFGLTGGAIEFFCTRPCEDDGDCGDTFSCVPVSDDPSVKHCFVASPD